MKTTNALTEAQKDAAAAADRAVTLNAAKLRAMQCVALSAHAVSAFLPWMPPYIYHLGGTQDG